MGRVARRTLNFGSQDESVVGPFLEVGSAEHRALEELSGGPLRSDSAQLRALVLLGVERVQERLLERAYNRAVEHGDFDDSNAWLRGTSQSRRARAPIE